MVVPEDPGDGALLKLVEIADGYGILALIVDDEDLVRPVFRFRDQCLDAFLQHRDAVAGGNDQRDKRGRVGHGPPDAVRERHRTSLDRQPGVIAQRAQRGFRGVVLRVRR